MLVPDCERWWRSLVDVHACGVLGRIPLLDIPVHLHLVSAQFAFVLSRRCLVEDGVLLAHELVKVAVLFATIL